MSTVLDSYERADLVIIARINSVKKGANRFGNDVSQVTMVVEKVFKGDVKVGEELTFGQGNGISDCNWLFYEDQIGERNLLYLNRREKPSDPFYVWGCDRSHSLEDAHDDLLYLENIDKARGRTRISGVVNREGDDETREGQQVRIVGKNKTYIATTDKNGVYELYDLPPGRYSLEPVLQLGWRVDEWRITREQTRAEWRRSNRNLPPPTETWFTLRARKHFGANIRLRLANRIAGRVTTPAGQPLSWVCVSLLPIKDPTLSLACNSLTEADGSFDIESVAAGSYKLLINYENIRSSRQPFPTLYYPGVAHLEAAKVFTVKLGESIEGVNFVVPTFYETVKFEGIVRYSNGRPASNRYVGFNTPKTAGVNGSINVQTDKRGRFSLTVLKGLRGELFSTYVPNDREVVSCPALKRALEQSGKRSVETPHLQVEANENQTFELRLPAAPCR